MRRGQSDFVTRPYKVVKTLRATDFAVVEDSFNEAKATGVGKQHLLQGSRLGFKKGVWGKPGQKKAQRAVRKAFPDM